MKPFSTTFEFDDLPLGTTTDAAGAEWRLEITAYGAAQIEFDRAGEWSVADIEIGTARRVDDARRWATGTTTLDRASQLFSIIAAALAKHFADDIDERVAAAMIQEGLRLPTMREEHGTLHSAIQGVQP